MCTPTDESYSTAIRYRTVKKRLDNLGYKDALSLDALPLTEKLLADLIRTTESLKHFKAIAENNIESYRQSSLSIDPYNYDNTKLVQECNELHNQLLEIKQNNLLQSKDLKRKIQRLENECSDLQLASSRNLKRIKDLELESSNKSKKIQELLGKCCKPTISNAGLVSKKRSAYPLRKPVLECEPLPTEIDDVHYPNLTKINPQIVDLISMADRKISSLNHEVIKLKDELLLQTDNVDTLRTQVTIKEKEINRLKKFQDGARLYNVPSKECTCHKNEPSCGQCNFINRRITGNYSQPACNKLGEISEIKVLQQAKSNLEQQLRDALDKQHDAMSQAMKLAERNEQLEKELRDIDHVAMAVEADCNSTVKQNNKRVSELEEKLENAMKKVRDLENSVLVEKRLSQELRADLEGCKLEKRNIERTLDNSLEERRRLTDRINELTIIENDLTDEIGRLSEHVETQKHALVELELANDILKKQTHEENLTENAKKTNNTRFSKDEIKKKNNVTASNDQKHSVSAANNNNINNMNSNGNNGHGEVSDDTTNNGMKKMNDDLRKLISQLERDRDYYKNQCNELNEKFNKASDTENAELWSKICDLKHQLNEKEAQISELQRDKRDWSREKFNLKNRVQMTKPHTRSPCNYCNVCRSMNACVCPSSARINGEISTGSKVVLARLEHERNTARADVERLIKERDILHERLELATEAHTSEQRRLRDRLRDLETKLNEVETEKQNILITQGSRQSTLSSLEDQLKDARNDLRMVKQELAAQRTQYFQLRALQDQTDQALGDVQSQLTQSESELTRALDRNKNLDQQQLQMDNQIMELKQEISTLRSNMARLDCEKDQLLINLDEKTERIATLEREVMIKEQQTMGVDQQLRDLQHKNQTYLEQSAEQERQFRNMQIEMENYQRQLNTAGADREHAIRENKRLQNELAAVTCETRTLQRELQASHAESFDLKRQLQTYVSEVRRAEELLNKKENERTEMLNHFRSLSLEASVLENNNQSLESEAAEAKGALQSTRDHVIDLEGQLADKECQIRRYEAQIKELSENVASLEIQVRQQIELRDGMELDSNALRDLCVKLDAQKDSLQEELSNYAAIKVRYEAQMSKLEMEQKAANDQRNCDRAAIDSLEKLLEQETRNSMESRRLNQELQNEISRLKERVSELQTKLSAESTKLRSYLNQAAEYDKQIADLRRKVTDEKFNRVQIEEERRRVNQYSGGKNIKPSEYNAGEPVKGTPQIVTFDTTNHTEQPLHGSLRPPQSLMGPKESTRSINAIHEAETTNRFELGIGSHKGLPFCKCIGESHDTHTKVNEPRVAFSHVVGVGEPAQSIALPVSGPISVKAIVEEDANHKDIRLKITEQPIMNKRALYTDDAKTKNEPSSLINSARKAIAESNTPTEIQVHDVDLVLDEEKKEEEKVVVSKADQIENDVLLKSNTNEEKQPLIIEKIPSKLSFHNLLAIQKLSNTILRNEKQPSVNVDDEIEQGYKAAEKVEKNMKVAETQVSTKSKRKERCGCSINKQLPNCCAHDHKEKARVEFELDANDKYDDDEGYNTSRLSKSPVPAVTSSYVRSNASTDNLSLEDHNVSIMKNSEPSLPQKIPVPLTITQQGSKPVKIYLEDGEILFPSIEFNPIDMNKNIMDIKKMADRMQNQINLVNNFKYNYVSNTNRNDGQKDSNNEKHKNKVHMKSSNLDEYTSPRIYTPIETQSGNKSDKQQLSSKRLVRKRNRSIITYNDKTKIDYPSDDENSERCKVSRSRTLAYQSNVPNDEHHMSKRQKNVTEKVSPVSNKKSRKVEIAETNRRSKSPRNRINDDNREEKNSHDANTRHCQINKCRRCPLRKKSSTRTLSHRSTNAETQSSQTQAETGTSYSHADAIQSSSSRNRRHNETQSPKNSRSPPTDRSTRSKLCDMIIKGPAKCFLGSSSHDQVAESSPRNTKSRSTEITQNSSKQYQSRSRPSTRERVIQSKSSTVKSSTPSYTIDLRHEKF